MHDVPDAVWLAAAGWAAAGWAAHPSDLCWLDCDEPGHYKRAGAREIVLCVPHAQVLEAGRYGSSYEGAPLPPESLAGAWPWQPASDQLIDVV